MIVNNNFPRKIHAVLNIVYNTDESLIKKEILILIKNNNTGWSPLNVFR